MMFEFFVLSTYPKIYDFIVLIYLQTIFVIKDQFSLDFNDLNWRYRTVCQKVNVISGCRLNTFVMPVQAFILFTGVSYSFKML